MNTVASLQELELYWLVCMISCCAVIGVYFKRSQRSSLHLRKSVILFGLPCLLFYGNEYVLVDELNVTAP